jgi:hypothetical protein
MGHFFFSTRPAFCKIRKKKKVRIIVSGLDAIRVSASTQKLDGRYYSASVSDTVWMIRV